MIRALTIAWACLASGCGSFLLPFDERPLPASHSLETVSGERLDLDSEGRLVVRPERGDVGLALGVGLSEEDDGVVVTHRLLPGTELRPGDRILRVWARVPPAGRVARAFRESTESALGLSADAVFSSLGTAEDRTVLQVKGSALDHAPRQTVVGSSPPDLAPVRSDSILKRGHAVSDLSDLRGYASASGWLVLDLLVERAGQTVALRAPLRRRPQPVFAQAWEPSLTRFQGVDLVPVAEFAPSLRPLHAELDHLLVARVARDAPTARAGLRPLDLVRVEDLKPLLSGESVSVRKPDGTEHELQAEPRGLPTEVWFPLLFTYQDNGVRTHVGIGPWDTTFHYSKRIDYEPTSNAYVERWRWSIGTTIQNSGLNGQAGSVHAGGVSLLMDSVRMDYLNDLWNADREAQTRGTGVAQ